MSKRARDRKKFWRLWNRTARLAGKTFVELCNAERRFWKEFIHDRSITIDGGTFIQEALIYDSNPSDPSPLGGH